MGIIDEIIKSAIDKSECVALFVIVMALLLILHGYNSRRMDDLLRKLRAHENGDEKE